ncbi:uncharacterized protein Z520_03969 [Fonsecaea multimorphosa CBS 102226]|uniref:ER-bound oxygenase mpaB/mpaB'/Rubber oxygenase catalytic domain-containing protein n=1 Tax=Fonsecaea multimorphosa CBS 102226 TaxID=1442371 RepID=A0A0D2KU54_9EURO|nr:uncharacterized protein Z520_03969 [Fonsecaea multimorphosa CBS 102226]KIY00284.1 hypothetical protein Z520_03969 [Fonsecaea multimorphosa CBS 102226]OAL27117.1 hypothetical protein AYO22_03748 [Fonsecaea multimorphosa]
MAWPNPFRRRDENTRTAWGYTFQLTPGHLTPEQAHPLKHTYDVLGEECYEILKQMGSSSADEAKPPQQKTDDAQLESVVANHSQRSISSTMNDSVDKTSRPSSTASQRSSKRDLYLLLRDHHSSHPKLQQLWDEVTTVPDWVDWAQIRRGQDVFYRYGAATLTGLAYQSLLGGMGANRVVEVLARTGGFSVKVARHRLFETTQHILECTRSLESIQPGGDGFASSVRVRLLHAAVRQRIMHLTKTRPSYYSVEEYGIPINDLDCIATIGTFSATIIYLSLPRQGIWLRRQETEDYIALWRLIAYYVGTPTEYFSTPERAKCMMESLLLNEINPSNTSQILANNIIRCLENQPPTYASRSFLEVNARWLNGNDLADALGLGRPGPWYWALMTGQCIFFACLCYTYRSIPALDRRKIATLRKVFWALIVEGKYGLAGEPTVFEFKYVPELGLGTAKGEDDEQKAKEVGIERRNLNTLLAATGVLICAGWVGVKISTALLGRVF